MAEDFYDYDDEEAAPRKRDHLFLWTVFILLLLGLAFACWLGSFYIFGHPEQPRNYRILQRMKKIEAPKRFPETKAPPGEFLNAQRLFERYSKYTRLQLENENAELLRIFLTNYRETKKLVPYVRGNFTIADAAELSANDFMSTGVVALAQSNDFPQVVIEHLFPTSADYVTKSRDVLKPGNPIKLEKTKDKNDLGVIIHIEKIPEGRLQFTVVQLMYPEYGLSGGVGTFSTAPPPDVNIEAGLPVMKLARVEPALKAFTDNRRSQPAAEPGAPGEPALPQGPQIVRVDTIPDGAKVPDTGALPEMPVATPVPFANRATPRKTESPPLALLKNTPPPRVLPTPSPAGPPPVVPATPNPRVPEGVLKPFIATNPEPGLSGARGNQWRTFKPGSAPAGRALRPAEAGSLADRGMVPVGSYLQGNFVVTAADQSRAVLRPRLATGESDPGVRIMVEYPNGAVAPREGAVLDRDLTIPYEIRDVRRGATGEITIYAREIIQQ
jgi:hypothetical protein